MQPSSEASHLTGQEKAAIIFLCLPKDKGSNLMQDLSDDEIHILTQNLTRLGNINPLMVEGVITDFLADMSGNAGVSGSVDAARRLLSEFMSSEQVDAILDDIRGPNSGRTIWESFSNLNEQVIFNYLSGEHDQMIAAILTKLRPEVTARVLVLFPQDRMTDVIVRMLKTETVPDQVLSLIEEAVATEFLPAATRKSGPDPHQRMAEILNKMDSGVFEDLSVSLEDRAPREFASIKAKMFTFEDLERLDKRTLSRLMRSVDDSVLLVALRGAKKGIRDAFLEALPTRSRDQKRQDLEMMEPVRKAEVRDAQDKIIDIANELVRQGQIRKPTEDDQLI